MRSSTSYQTRRQGSRVSRYPGLARLSSDFQQASKPIVATLTQLGLLVEYGVQALDAKVTEVYEEADAARAKRDPQTMWGEELDAESGHHGPNGRSN